MQQRDEGQPDVQPAFRAGRRNPARPRFDPRPRPRLDLIEAGAEQGLPPPARAQGVEADAGGDAIKPRPPRRPVAQAGEFAPAAQQGLLDAVLGILHAAHHAIAMALQLAAHGAGQGGKGA